MTYQIINDRYSNQPDLVTYKQLVDMCNELGWYSDFEIVDDKIYDNKNEVVAILNQDNKDVLDFKISLYFSGDVENHKDFIKTEIILAIYNHFSEIGVTPEESEEYLTGVFIS